MKKRTIYYKSYTDDFIESKNQFYQLPDDYTFSHKGLVYRFFASVFYKVVTVIDFFYCKFILKINVKNSEILKEYKNSGYFLFGNHTQPVGDAFIPTYVSSGKRVSVLVSTANLGIPFLGKLLPMLGALPISKTKQNLIKLKNTISERIKRGDCVVIYPEAHVWEYYTKIRPFPCDSFRFPVENNVPTFCITTTYQKPIKGSKPQITIYVDGPFFPDKSCPLLKQRENLRDKVYECMQKRSENSTYEYIHYEEAKNV